MTQTNYNKLVRDNIPNIIRENGGKPITRRLGDEEFRQALAAKIQEEGTELAADFGKEELADVYELVIAAAGMLGLSMRDLDQVRREKLSERGGFEDRIFLERVVDNE